jgi:hypothetical protein
MSTRDAFVCTLLVFALSAAPGAWADTLSLTPVHVGSIFDQDPFDGRGDAIDETTGMTVDLNSQILDLRGVVEFDLAPS